MQAIARTIGLSFIGLCLLTLAIKAFLPLGVLGYAPLALPLGPGSQPIEIVIWYGTEKEAWLEEAARRFADSGASANGRPITVRLVGMGSGEIVERIRTQNWGADGVPTVASPASSIWIELLRNDWALANSSELIVNDPPALVLTPIVAVAWEQRAEVLWPNGVNNFWNDLHDAVIDPQGWQGVAERNGFAAESAQAREAQNWGQVKLGHTNPLSSNSGAQALTLMAYAFHNKADDLRPQDIADPAFQRWLREIEEAVLDFGDSTGTFMTTLVQVGPSKYDVVLSYENLAIEYLDPARSRWNQNLRVYYPPVTIFSDHPYAVLNEPYTSADQRAAAEVFQRFLLSRPIQELALQSGFRPVDPSVSVSNSDPSNPFNRYAGYGVQVDISRQAQTPSGESIRALLDFWQQQILPTTLRP